MSTIIHDGYNSALGVFAVTPSDTVELTNSTRAIRANTSGTIKITTINGSVCTCAFTGGETRAIRAKLIWATGTTATGIEGMY